VGTFEPLEAAVAPWTLLMQERWLYEWLRPEVIKGNKY
jgi:hypothetical protein